MASPPTIFCNEAPSGTGYIYVENMGYVAVGCPKIWTSDRVFSVLDGITRDVDSIPIRALQGLDPNAANQAIMETLSTSFSVQGQFDQAAALKNQAVLQNFNTQHAAQLADFKTSENTRQQLLAEQARVTQKQIAVRTQETNLIAQGADPNATSTSAKSQLDKDLVKAKALGTAYTNQLTAISGQLSQAQSSLSDLSTLSSTAAPTSLTTGPSAASIPTALQNALADQIAKGSLPPTVQMDNVIDLLNERIAREFAAMYDDLMRDAVADHGDKAAEG